MNENSFLKRCAKWAVPCSVVVFLFGFCGLLDLSNSLAEIDQVQVPSKTELARAKVFVQAGDYRRAVEACQRHIDLNPSVEAYVYLAYVYQAIDGYLAFLAKQEDYVKVEQLSLNLTAREVIDIIDPPNVMARMAQELIHEGLRQQFDITASMANQLNRVRTDELWMQQAAWRESQPDSWWAGVPKEWKW